MRWVCAWVRRETLELSLTRGWNSRRTHRSPEAFQRSWRLSSQDSLTRRVHNLQSDRLSGNAHPTSSPGTRPSQTRMRQQQQENFRCAQCGPDPATFKGAAGNGLMLHMVQKQGGQQLIQDSFAPKSFFFFRHQRVFSSLTKKGFFPSPTRVFFSLTTEGFFLPSPKSFFFSSLTEKFLFLFPHRKVFISSLTKKFFLPSPKKVFFSSPGHKIFSSLTKKGGDWQSRPLHKHSRSACSKSSE